MDSRIDTKVEVLVQDFIITQDESIDIKIDLNFLVNVCNTVTLSVISDITIDDNQKNEDYSIVVYFVKQVSQ